MKNNNRKCWKCENNLIFAEFLNQNKAIDIEILERLWDHPTIELYCCKCYNTYRSQDNIDYNNDNNKKIVFFGLSNGGKSAIIESILSQELKLGIHQTKGMAINSILVNEVEYFIWELSGLKYYQRRWLNEMWSGNLGIDELIYVINVREYEKYNESVELLNRAFRIFQTYSPDMKLYILLHQTDPDLDLDSNNLKELQEKIKSLGITPNGIGFTSLLYYKNNYLNYSESLNQSTEEGLEFGNLVLQLITI